MLVRPVHRGRWSRSWSVAALLAGIGVALTLLASVVGIRPVRVVSGSMAPAVEPGDWVVVRDLAPGDARPGEVMLFRFPLGSDGRAIKRVAAIGGDPVPTEGADAPVGTVPADHVWLLGDNTTASIDSRDFGPVPEAELVGRVMFVVPEAVGTWTPRIAAILALGGLGLIATVHLQLRRDQ